MPTIISRRQFRILLLLKNKKRHNHENHLLTIPYFFRNVEKMWQKLTSAAVVISALIEYFMSLYVLEHYSDLLKRTFLYYTIMVNLLCSFDQIKLKQACLDT